jgi:hypothetical protein
MTAPTRTPPNASALEIGRLLRASATGCVVGCKVSQIDAPSFGGMVRIPLDDSTDGSGTQVYGLVYDIHIDDDGLVRQLVTAERISEDVIQDNRVNRNVPVEISVLFVGYRARGQVYHLLPPRPPLTLDAIYTCGEADLCAFTSAGRFGYFRHILRAADLPVAELLAAHLLQVSAVQDQNGRLDWIHSATGELITLLRDDYPTLMSVLGALSDANLNY